MREEELPERAKGMKVLRHGFMALILVVLLALLIGCDEMQSDEGKLKVGVLPILDVLPLYVAEQEGYYAKEGISVELVPFGSALERDAAFQADQLDAQVNDLVSAALLNKGEEHTRVIRTAMRATPQKAMFAIVASGQNTITHPADLKGIEIGVSKNTIIEYSTDRMLGAAGVPDADVAKADVPKIPVRVELLSQGTLHAACLPEPFASLGVVQGGRVVVDDRAHPEYGQSVVSASVRALARKPASIKRLLVAYEQAVTAINAEPEKYRGLLIDKGRVPEAVKSSFQMPTFPKAGVPSESEAKDVVQWMMSKKLLEKVLPYDHLVSPVYLPK
jgi:NitT/TauT family transport system substrate-binding protein